MLTLAVFVYVNWNHADRIRYVLKNKRTECEPSQFVSSREHSGREECSKQFCAVASNGPELSNLNE